MSIEFTKSFRIHYTLYKKKPPSTDLTQEGDTLNGPFPARDPLFHFFARFSRREWVFQHFPFQKRAVKGISVFLMAIILPLSAAGKYRVISAGQRRHVRSSPICKMDAADDIGPYIRTVKNPPASRQAMPEDPRSMLQSRSAEKKEIRDSLFVFSDNGKKPAMAGHDFPFFFIRLKSRFCHAPCITVSIAAVIFLHPLTLAGSVQADSPTGISARTGNLRRIPHALTRASISCAERQRT